MFWMHHAMIDKMWYDWQLKSETNAKAFHGGLTQDLAHFTTYPVGAPPAVTLNSSLPVSYYRMIS